MYVYKHITNENTDNFNSSLLQILLQDKQALLSYNQMSSHFQNFQNSIFSGVL